MIVDTVCAIVLLASVAKLGCHLTATCDPSPSLVARLSTALPILLCAGALLIHRDRRANAALMAISISLSLLLGATAFEWHLRSLVAGTPLAPAPALDDQRLAEGLRQEIGVADWRQRELVADALAAGGRELNSCGGLFNLLPWADAGYLDPLPLSTMARTLTLHCNEGGFWPVFETDRYGFNNADPAWDSDRARLLLVGDSFAHGACVQQDDSLAARLLERGYGAVSIGIGGNGPLLELAGLTEYGPVFRPEFVIWLYFDWHMLNRLSILEPDSGWGGEAYSPVLMRYLEDGFSQDLAARQDEVDALWRTGLGDFEARRAADAGFDDHRLAAVNRVRAGLGLRSFAGLDDQLDMEETIELFLRILATAKRRVESWGGKLYLATYYDISRFRGGPETNRDDVLPRVEALGIPVIDIDAAIAATPVPLANFPFHGTPTPFNATGWAHFNAQGYGVFAAAIAAAIE